MPKVFTLNGEKSKNLGRLGGIVMQINLFDLSQMGDNLTEILGFLSERAKELQQVVLGRVGGLVIEVLPQNNTDIDQSERSSRIYNWIVEYNLECHLLYVPVIWKDPVYVVQTATQLHLETGLDIMIVIPEIEAPDNLLGHYPLLDPLYKEMAVNKALTCFIVGENDIDTDEDFVPAEEEYDANEETMRDLEEMGAFRDE